MRKGTFSAAAILCLASSALWPFVANALSRATQSPVERALQNAWCGLTPHDASALLGHCPACWVGSAAFFAVAALLLRKNYKLRECRAPLS